MYYGWLYSNEPSTCFGLMFQKCVECDGVALPHLIELTVVPHAPRTFAPSHVLSTNLFECNPPLQVAALAVKETTRLAEAKVIEKEYNTVVQQEKDALKSLQDRYAIDQTLYSKG